MSHVFISHASPDFNSAMLIVGNLEARGVRCWVAPRDIDPGSVYQEALWLALEQAGALLLVHSASTSASAHVVRELEVASRFRVPIVPLVVDDASPTGACGYMIAGLQLMQFSQPNDADWHRLVQACDVGSGDEVDQRGVLLLSHVFIAAGFSAEEARRKASAMGGYIEACASRATGALAALQIVSRLPFLDAPERQTSVRAAFEKFLDEVSLSWEQGTDLIWPSAGDRFDDERMVAIHEPRIGTLGHYPLRSAHNVEACLRPGLVVVGPADVPFGRIQAVVRVLRHPQT